MRYLRRGRAATLPATKTPDRLGESGMFTFLRHGRLITSHADKKPVRVKVIENINNLIRSRGVGKPLCFFVMGSPRGS